MGADGKSGDEAAQTFLEKRRAPQKKGMAGFMEFLWNKENKTVLGRTGMSWLEITIFYIIFYSCLAAFWAIALALFVYTLRDDRPRWYGKGSIIGINPGVGYQPWLIDNPDSTLIYLRMNDPKSWETYVEQLDKFINKYKDTNNTRVCGPGESNMCDAQGNCPKDSCRFDPNVFGPCQHSPYGYSDGKPCVLLSLNRLIGWLPMAYPKGSEPAAIRGRYESGAVTMSCRGENPVDNEHIGSVKYYPPYGMDGKYFPYRVMANYHQPMAMVQFESIDRNIVVQVECVAYAYNIVHDAQERMGLIHFEILIDDAGVASSGGSS